MTLSQKGENKKAIDEELDPALGEAHENLAKLILSSNNVREFWQFWITNNAWSFSSWIGSLFSLYWF